MKLARSLYIASLALALVASVALTTGCATQTTYADPAAAQAAPKAEHRSHPGDGTYSQSFVEGMDGVYAQVMGQVFEDLDNGAGEHRDFAGDGMGIRDDVQLGIRPYDDSYLVIIPDEDGELHYHRLSSRERSGLVLPGASYGQTPGYWYRRSAFWQWNGAYWQYTVPQQQHAQRAQN